MRAGTLKRTLRIGLCLLAVSGLLLADWFHGVLVLVALVAIPSVWAGSMNRRTLGIGLLALSGLLVADGFFGWYLLERQTAPEALDAASRAFWGSIVATSLLSLSLLVLGIWLLRRRPTLRAYPSTGG